MVDYTKKKILKSLILHVIIFEINSYQGYVTRAIFNRPQLATKSHFFADSRRQLQSGILKMR